MAGLNQIELLIRLIGQDASLREALSRSQKGLRDFGAAGTKAGSSATRGLDGAASSALRVAGALTGVYVGFQTVNSLLSQFVRTASQFETARIQLNSLFGDAEKGQQAFAWVKTFARDTPYELDGVLRAFQTLKNFGLDPMDGTLQSVADQAAKFGGRQEDLIGISLALGQSWAAQKLQGQDILQLINRGVPVWQLLEDVTGRTTAELRDMSQAGELGRETISALIQRMGELSSGASLAQMEAFGGVVSNVKDTWAQFLDGIGQAGALDSLKTALSGVLTEVEKLNQSGGLAALSGSISEGISTTVGIVRDLASVLSNLSGILLPMAELWVAAKVVAYSKALHAVAINGPLAAGGLFAVQGALAAVARQLYLIPIAVTIDQLFKLTGAALDHRNAVRGMGDAYESYISKQNQIKAQSSKDAFTTIISKEEFEQQTKNEQDAYVRRLQNARAFWQSEFNIRTRQGDTGEDARRANDYTREYSDALDELKIILRNRQKEEKLSADRISAIKKEETGKIVKELDKQKERYDRLNSDLKAALSERERLLKESVENQQRIQEEFSDLTESQRTPSSAETTLRSFDAQRALQQGDAEQALRIARQAAEAVRELRSAGDTSASLTLTGRRLQEVAAAAQKEIDARKLEEVERSIIKFRAEAKTVADTIEDLVIRAKALEQLEVSFDKAKAIDDAHALWQVLNAELAENPIFVTVKLKREGNEGEDLIKSAEVKAQPRAYGGQITGYSPTPTSDNILVAATAGEYMQSVAAVKHAGLPFMQALNARMIPRGAIEALMRGIGSQRLATGGPVLSSFGNLPNMNYTPERINPTSETVVLLDLNGRRYRTNADSGTAQELERALRLERLKS